MTYKFKLEITGNGNSANDCWLDAIESLALDPGNAPEAPEEAIDVTEEYEPNEVKND